MNLPDRPPEEQFTVPFVKAILIFRDRFLLQRRAKKGDPYEGFWELPGGRMRRDETASAALAREVSEETGLRLLSVLGQPAESLTDRFGRGVQVLAPLITVEVCAGPWPGSLGHYFACLAEGEPTDSEEGDRHRLIRPGEFQTEFLEPGATGQCSTLDLLAMRTLLQSKQLERFLQAPS